LSVEDVGYCEDDPDGSATNSAMSSLKPPVKQLKLNGWHDHFGGREGNARLSAATFRAQNVNYFWHTCHYKVPLDRFRSMFRTAFSEAFGYVDIQRNETRNAYQELQDEKTERLKDHHDDCDNINNNESAKVGKLTAMPKRYSAKIYDIEMSKLAVKSTNPASDETQKSQAASLTDPGPGIPENADSESLLTVRNEKTPMSKKSKTAHGSTESKNPATAPSYYPNRHLPNFVDRVEGEEMIGRWLLAEIVLPVVVASHANHTNNAATSNQVLDDIEKGKSATTVGALPRTTTKKLQPRWFRLKELELFGGMILVLSVNL
jgi:hypothetical protein